MTMKDAFTPAVKKAFSKVLINNLRQYADDADANGDDDRAVWLEAMADEIESGTAHESMWLEAIEQMEV
jgi:hypothetical protein